MATEKPRFTITMDDKLLEQVSEYRHLHRVSTQSKAIIELVRSGLKEYYETPLENENAPSFSDEALRMAQDYDSLDRHGKAAVRGLMDEELLRMEELENLVFADPAYEVKVINLFDNPSAAGLALDVTGQSCRPYELKPEDPQGAAYAVRIQGDSMEPYFPDGSIAFVNHDQMRDGDIGIFCVDGATVCKQWHYDPVLGITYLFSLNRQRDDADLVITRNSGRSLVWQGRVITKRRFDLPGM